MKIYALFLILSIIILVSVPSVSDAATAGASTVSKFGGFLKKSYFCSCSGNFLLTIKNLVTPTGNIELLYQPGYSSLKMFYNFYTPGVAMLGTYTSGGKCEVYVGESCETKGNPKGTITSRPLTGFGTSKTPSLSGLLSF